MRGKYITTNIRLAVLAGGKKPRPNQVKEMNSSMNSFQPIFKKMVNNQTTINPEVENYLAKAV